MTVASPPPVRYLRKIIKITAEDSPNVQYARAQIAHGLIPDNTEIIPGVLSWEEYQYRRKVWDPVRQCIGLDGEFYRGAETLMYPPLWLNRAEHLDLALRQSRRQRVAKALGIDPAEGGDKTTFAIVDEWGLIDLISILTPDTSVITSHTLKLIRQWNIPHDRVAFDRGGGGKQHADRLWAMGFKVRTVAFGETIKLEPKRGMRQFEERKETLEEKYEFKNRRAQMAFELRELLDPAREETLGLSPLEQRTSVMFGSGNQRPRGFAIPAKFTELRKQMAVIPLMYDGEGRIILPPKNKQSEDAKVKSLVELIGHSPDEWDSVMLGTHAMLHKARRAVAGVA